MEFLLVTVALLAGLLLGHFITKAKIQGELMRYKTLYESSLETNGAIKDQFKQLAGEIFENQARNFELKSEKSLQGAIAPLRENLEHFHRRIEKYYDGENSERLVLKGEIKKIVELNQKLSDEAGSLARALRGDSKLQGNWGEMILEKVLEASGLRREREYRTQVFQKNEEGRSQFLDVVIDLPENKHLIIDSKVTLRSYDLALRASDQLERETHMSQFVLAVKDHIKGLSAKKYSEGEAVLSPDFILLFFPLESAYALALDHDPSLFQAAWDKKVIIVSPTTLLATLKTVAGIWTFQRQSENAQEIAITAGRLYDKFVGLAGDLDDVEKQLGKALESASGVKNKLINGRGNLVAGVQKLQELGAKNSKSLPETWHQSVE